MAQSQDTGDALRSVGKSFGRSGIRPYRALGGAELCGKIIGFYRVVSRFIGYYRIEEGRNYAFSRFLSIGAFFDKEGRKTERMNR